MCIRDSHVLFHRNGNRLMLHLLHFFMRAVQILSLIHIFNQRLDAETINIVAEEFGFQTE